MFMKHPRVAGKPVQVSEKAFAVHQKRGWVEVPSPNAPTPTEAPADTSAEVTPPPGTQDVPPADVPASTGKPKSKE